MTVDFAKEYLLDDCEDCPENENGECMTKSHCFEVKRMAIQALEQTGWIPVSERLPKPKETENLIAKYYLIQDEYGDMMVARYDGIGWEQMYQHEYIEDEVVAWMPLPQPYKAESEDKE